MKPRHIVLIVVGLAVIAVAIVVILWLNIVNDIEFGMSGTALRAAI
jgi:hypothetical protein